MKSLKKAIQKLFINNPGSMSCKAVFIMENHIKQCWLTKRLKIICAVHAIQLNTSFIEQVRSTTSLVWQAIDLAVHQE